MKKVLLLVSTLMLLASCQQLDIIGNDSITAFKELLDTLADNVTSDDVRGGWQINAPDNSVSFFWSRDFNNSFYDLMLISEAEAFSDAGLDWNKLPQNMIGTGDLAGKIIIGVELGQEEANANTGTTPLAAYEQLVLLKPDLIGYHHTMDHFGVSVGDGNVIEWAKDISDNDNGLVFVLDPQPFLAADVDPQKIAGWTFAKVETMDANGRTVEVDKLLKPFDIR